jgi:hypothetical protein
MASPNFGILGLIGWRPIPVDHSSKIQIFPYFH